MSYKFSFSVTRCHVPPDKSSTHNLLYDWSGSAVSLGSSITYNCIDTPKQGFYESDRSKSSLSILCHQDTAEYVEPQHWPNCIQGELIYMYSYALRIQIQTVST